MHYTWCSGLQPGKYSEISFAEFQQEMFPCSFLYIPFFIFKAIEIIIQCFESSNITFLLSSSPEVTMKHKFQNFSQEMSCVTNINWCQNRCFSSGLKIPAELKFWCWQAQFWLWMAVAAKIQDGAQNNNAIRSYHVSMKYIHRFWSCRVFS